MEARHPSAADEGAAQLEALVARIRARGTAPLPAPPPEAVARFLAHTAHEVPMSDDELAEHERMWQAVDAEVRALEDANGSTTGPA